MKPARAWYRMSVGRFMILVAVAGLLTAGLVLAFDSAREVARRSRCVNNLRQIALALHAYHSANGCFPPAYVAGPDGRPWHSWRLLIEPYLEKTPVYNRYNFHEPWDGPNNRKLIGQHSYYCCPTHRGGSSPFASYVAVVGPGTVFPGASSASITDVHDGTDNTLMLVECSDLDIPWTEPRDLSLSELSFRVNDPGRPGPSSRHPGGAKVVFVGGRCHFLKDTIRPRWLKPLFTIGGGETGDPDDY